MFLPLSVAVYTLAAATPRERLPALTGGVLGVLVVVVAVGVGDGRVWRWEELRDVLLAWLALLLVPLWVGVVARARRGRAAEEPAAAPTTSGCGSPGSCMTWCRTASR